LRRVEDSIILAFVQQLYSSRRVLVLRKGSELRIIWFFIIEVEFESIIEVEIVEWCQKWYGLVLRAYYYCYKVGEKKPPLSRLTSDAAAPKYRNELLDMTERLLLSTTSNGNASLAPPAPPFPSPD